MNQSHDSQSPQIDLILVKQNLQSGLPPVVKNILKLDTLKVTSQA